MSTTNKVKKEGAVAYEAAPAARARRFDVDSKGIPIALLAREGDAGLEYAGGAFVGMPKEVRAQVDALQRIATPPSQLETQASNVAGADPSASHSSFTRDRFGDTPRLCEGAGMITTLIPPTIEAAIAAKWTGLRVTCPIHGSRSMSWLALARDGNTQVSLSSLIDRLRCHQCHRRPSEVLLESETGTALLDF